VSKTLFHQDAAVDIDYLTFLMLRSPVKSSFDTRANAPYRVSSDSQFKSPLREQPASNRVMHAPENSFDAAMYRGMGAPKVSYDAPPQRQIRDNNPSYGIPPTKEFEKYVADELRYIKAEMNSEAGMRHGLTERVQSVLPQIDGCEQSIFMLRKQVEALAQDQKLMHGNSNKGAVSLLYQKFDDLQADVKQFQSKTATEAEDNARRVNERIEVEADTLRDLLIKQLNAASSNDEHFRDTARKHWDIAVVAEKGVQGLDMQFAQFEHDNMHEFRKLHELLHGQNIQMKKLEMRMQEMALDHEDRLEEAYVSIQRAQSQIFRGELEQHKNSVNRRTSQLEVSLSEALVEIHSKMQADRDDLKTALQEIRSVISVEINGRRAVDRDLSRELEDVAQQQEAAQDALRNEIASMRNHFTKEIKELEKSQRQELSVARAHLGAGSLTAGWDGGGADKPAMADLMRLKAEVASLAQQQRELLVRHSGSDGDRDDVDKPGQHKIEDIVSPGGSAAKYEVPSPKLIAKPAAALTPSGKAQAARGRWGILSRVFAPRDAQESALLSHVHSEQNI
jgi:hypothetical protein